MRNWRVWCRVSGLVTGTREGWLKDAGGAIQELTESEARAKCQKWNNHSGNSLAADFRYTPVPASEWSKREENL